MEVRQSKYLMPNIEVLNEFLERFKETEDMPCKHQAHGIFPKKERVGNEYKPTGEFRVDVLWNFNDLKEFEEFAEFEQYKLDLDYEGKNVVLGRSYLKDKI